jgi:hypothetical protein
MKNLLYFYFVLLFAGLGYGQPKDILVDWECNMEIEILSGRFNPGTDIVSVRGDFNAWSTFDMVVDPLDPNYYITPYPILITQLEVGDTVTFYKFFYTPNTWETGANKFYILTQDDYNNNAATISRAFNDATLNTVTNQETIITFEVDCNNAVSFINGLPFPVINTCRLAGGTYPLQWPGTGWPDGDIGLTLPMYDDGTHGDTVAGDLKFTTEVTFPPYTVFDIVYKYGINYGDPINNGGGNDNEAGIGNDHNIQLSQYLISAKVENIFGKMGFHTLIDPIIPVELTSFTAQLNEHQVVLQWQTATEANNQGFEIERKMGNNKWERIGFVEGHGTTINPQVYMFNDDVSNNNAISFSYRLKQIDYDGSFEYSHEIEVINSITPDEYILSQNYPNPFNPSTTIKFSLPSSGQTSLKIFNDLGEEIAVLLNKELTTGSYEVEWNASGLPSGIYFYQLKTKGFVETKKMILMK